MKKEILQKILLKYYSLSMANMLLRGVRKPNYKHLLILHNEDGVPFQAWDNIKEYIIKDNKKVEEEEKE